MNKYRHRQPNFFILGAQKAGTTFLAHVLSKNIDIFFSNPKEPQFFSRKQISKTEYLEYLSKYYANASSQKWVGEGSTTYLQWPATISNFKKFIPGQPKFIICLRHPTEKAISYFVHNWRRHRYDPSTRLIDTLGLSHTLSPQKASFYAPSLRNWLAAYPKNDFCFLKFDTLQVDPEKYVHEALRFLEITGSNEIPSRRINAGLPLIWAAGGLVFASDENDRSNSIITQEELIRLHDSFQKDIVETEKLSGLDLSDWYRCPEFYEAS